MSHSTQNNVLKHAGLDQSTERTQFSSTENIHNHEELSDNLNNRLPNKTEESPNAKTCCTKLTDSFKTAWRSRGIVKTAKFRLASTVAIWGFLTNVERAVILPTLYLYLKTFWNQDTADKYYGIIMTMFSLAVLIFTPISGLLAHAGLRVKFIMLLSNFLEIIGNLMYMCGYSPWLLLCGRFVAGTGGAAEPPFYADLTRITTKEERTPYIISMLVVKQVGLIVGPAVTIVMSNLVIETPYFTINVYNGSGLLMAILWLLHTILAVAIYPNLNQNGTQVRLENEDGSGCYAVKHWMYANPKDQEIKLLPITDAENDVYSTKENSNMLEDINASGDVMEKPVSKSIQEDESRARAKSKCCSTFEWKYLKNYCTYSIVSLLCVAFTAYLCLIAVECTLPPLAFRLFGWTELKIGYVYLGASALVIFVYIILRILTAYFEDRHLMLFGLVVLFFAYLLLAFVVTLLVDKPENIAVPATLVGIAIHVIGMPFVFAFPESLYTKFTDIKDMDRAQSIYRTVSNVAYLVGPFLGGNLTLIPPIVVFAILLGSVLFSALLVVVRYSKFSSRYFHPSQIGSQERLALAKAHQLKRQKRTKRKGKKKKFSEHDCISELPLNDVNVSPYDVKTTIKNSEEKC